MVKAANLARRWYMVKSEICPVSLVHGKAANLARHWYTVKVQIWSIAGTRYSHKSGVSLLPGFKLPLFGFQGSVSHNEFPAREKQYKYIWVIFFCFLVFILFLF